MRVYKLFPIFICLLLFLAVFSSVVMLEVAADDQKIPADDWYMFLHDSGRSGYTPSSGPATNNTLWTYDTLGALLTSPAIVEGRLYIGAKNVNTLDETHMFYCLDAETGNLIWNTSITQFGRSSPTIVDDRIYIGASDHNVYCLDALNGDILWSFLTGNQIISSPLYFENKIYIGSIDQKLYCLNTSDGSQIWNYTTDGVIYASPAIYEVLSAPDVYDERVFVCSYKSSEGFVYCLDADTGDEEWIYDAGYGVSASPVVLDDRVYVSVGLQVICLDVFHGTLVFSWDVPQPPIRLLYTSPVVANGYFYVATDTSPYTLFCVDISTQEEVWNVSIGTISRNSLTLTDDKLYVCHTDTSGGFTYKATCFDITDGSIVWEYEIDNSFSVSPVVSNGCLYVASRYTIYCFKDEILPDPQLEITTDTSVDEGEEFTVTITADDIPIEGVSIAFAAETYLTDDEGKTTISAPMIEENTTYVITATKSGYLQATESINVINIEDPPPYEDPQLEIDCPSSTSENEYFQVTITANNTPIKNVTVAFNESLDYTDNSGQVSLFAPDVDENTTYTISANKDGYKQDSASIIILKQEDETYTITGHIYDQQDNPLSNVQICIAMHSGEEVSAQQCTITDDTGKYLLELSTTGVYQIEAIKTGYGLFIDTTNIESSLKTYDITLEPTDEPSTDITTSELDEVFNEKIEAKKPVGKITIEESNNTIKTYNTDVEISELETENQRVSFKVSGEKDTPEMFIVIKVDLDALGTYDVDPLLSDIKIVYDGKIIPRVDSLEDLDSQSNEPSWYPVYSDEGEILCIGLRIPNFSEHQITITIETVGLVVAVLFYIFVFVLGITFFVGIGKKRR